MIADQKNISNCRTLIKRIGESYVVWFEPSRSFVLLEKPAYDVFSLYSEGLNIKEIINVVRNNHELTKSEYKKFVKEIIDRIEIYSNQDNAPYKLPEIFHDLRNTKFGIFSEKSYRIENKSIVFHYGSDWLMNSFHPFFNYLEDKSFSTFDFLFELFEHEHFLIFKCNGELVEAFRYKDLNYFRGCVTQKLYSVLYDIDSKDWMINIHASGVSDGKSAIIFPAQAGSGKSTLAALLHAHNYIILSDDFIAIDRIKGAAYRLPAAISVKDGSVKILSQYYPELIDIKSQKASTGKIVRHLPLNNNQKGLANMFPVKTFVFVNYSPNEPFSIMKVELKEALPSLLAETWVNPDPENVRRFFDWIDTKAFYRLKYSDNYDAIQTITNLFTH
jgi:hypothetical protein